MIRDAIRRRTSFNVVRLETMLKIDVFIRKGTPFERASFERSVRMALGREPGARAFDLTTPEDVVLHKLQWFRLGGGVSERQWSDLVGVLEVQADAVDVAYLQRWAGELGLDDLLARALAEAADRR